MRSLPQQGFQPKPDRCEDKTEADDRHDRPPRYMRAFARAWPAESPSSIVQQPAAQLPWAHNMVILDKLKDADDRAWYATHAVENR